MSDIDDLPDDPVLLKRLLMEREIALVERNGLIEHIRQKAAEQLEALRLRMEAEHKAAIAAILRRSYGPKAERFDPRQLLLFGLQVDAMPLDEPSIAEESRDQMIMRLVRNRHNDGRQTLPESLPRIEIEHDLEDAEKACPCCGEVRQRIGQEVSEQLEYLPASLHVLSMCVTSTPANAAKPRPWIFRSRRRPSPRSRSRKGWRARDSWPT